MRKTNELRNPTHFHIQLLPQNLILVQILEKIRRDIKTLLDPLDQEQPYLSFCLISILYLILKNCLIFFKQKNLFTLSGTIFLISTLIMPIPSGSFFTSYGATIFWINIGILLAYEKYVYKN